MDVQILSKRLGIFDHDPNIEVECSNIMKLFSLSIDDFCDQWEAYSIASHNEEDQSGMSTKLREFQAYLQKNLENEAKRKSALADSIGPSSTVKRKKLLVGRENMSPGSFMNATPVRPKKRVINSSERFGTNAGSSPSRPLINSNGATPTRNGAGDGASLSSPVNYKSQLGSIVTTLNPHISLAEKPTSATQIKLSMHISLKKYQYRTMYQKLSEAAEILDQQIERMIQIIQEHYKIPDEDIGNPAIIHQNAITAVGRIVSDDPTEDHLSSTSLMLETCRRIGNGAKIRLNVKAVKNYAFFSGQIVALKGKNASGEHFTVSEILEIPQLPSAAFTSGERHDQFSHRKLIVASGPYTAANNLDFEPLSTLIDHINREEPDSVILLGPFIDSTHQMIQNGDFDLPDNSEGTLDDFFKFKITNQFSRINKNSLVIVIPNIRDTASNHAAFPQPALDKISLALPKHVKCLPNPAVFSLDDTVIAAASVDSIKDIVGSLLLKSEKTEDPDVKFKKAFEEILNQRQIYPVFPASIPSQGEGITPMSGQSVDVPYWSLAELHQTKPDILIVPSLTRPMVSVTSNVVTVNPGRLTKGNSAGTFAIINIAPPGTTVTGNQDQPHELWNRARVDIQMI